MHKLINNGMNIDYSVTDDQKHALKEDGIVKLPGLINSSLLKELNKCFDWSISNHISRFAMAVENYSLDMICKRLWRFG